MDFESFLFEAHQRILGACVRDRARRDRLAANTRWYSVFKVKDSLGFCRLVQIIFAGTAILLFIALLALHFTYVGYAGCLQDIVRRKICHHVDVDVPAGSWSASSVAVGPEAFGDDLVVAVVPPERQTPLSATNATNHTGNVQRCSGIPRDDEILYIYYAPDLVVESSNETVAAKSSPVQCEDCMPNRSLARYEWSRTPAILSLDKNVRSNHSFVAWHVVLNESDPGTCHLWTLPIVEWQNVAVINMLMFSFQTGGYLRNLVTNETWSWTEQRVKPPTLVLDNILRKISILMSGVLSFCFTSAITALVIRLILANCTLMIAGVLSVVRSIAPRSFGTLTTEDIISPYSWLAARWRIWMRRGDGSSANLHLVAHFSSLVVIYAAYEATQFAWAFWFYPFSYPAEMVATLYLWAFSAEYFSAFFARSLLTVRLFPRYHLLLWIGFHTYLYSSPYGCTELASVSSLLLLWAIMLHFVLDCEVPALIDGSVSSTQRRSIFVQILGPTWTAALPPFWTLFHPPNQETNQRTPAIAAVGVGLEAGLEGVIVSSDDEGYDSLNLSSDTDTDTDSFY